MCIIHIIHIIQIIHTIHTKGLRLMNDLTLTGTQKNSITTGLQSVWFNDFFNYLDVTEKSIATYKRAIKQFCKYMALEGITNPTREDIIAYRDYLKADHKATTVQAYIIAVRLFFQWTELRGIYPNVANKVKGAKISKEHKKDSLTTKQAKRVLETIDKSTLQGLRDYAIFSLMITGGLRTIEVSRANIEDLRTLGDNTVLYIQGKGRQEKTDYVKLAEPVEDAIRNYLKACPVSDVKSALFKSTSHNSMGGRLSTRSISGIVKECMKGAGYDSNRLTAHSLRHTAGTLNLKNGGTLEETQQLLRHTNINTTMIYLHHLEREQNQSESRIAKALF